MKNLVNLITILGIGIFATGCAGSFRARGATWVEPPPPVVVAPPPVMAPPPPVVVGVPLPPPINVQVTETIVVDVFNDVWDWTIGAMVRVKVGTAPRPHTHVVVATWNVAWGCYTYVGFDGQVRRAPGY